MKTSFIIPSYQQGDHLGQCLDSILQQGLLRQEYEVLVFDGGSTDQTLEILRGHPSQPRWVSEPDGGQANAVNLGMRQAQGDIIAWINSDDFYLPGALQCVLAHFQNQEHCRILYGNAIRVDKDGNKLMDYPVEDWNYHRLLEKCFLCQPATFFRRELLLDYGFLNESFHLALDLEFWLRVGRREQFLRVPEHLAAAREYPTNKSNSFPLRMQVEALRAGYIHTGQLSRRRLWSVAENLVFLKNKGLKAALKARPGNPLRNTYFWVLKICTYFVIKCKAARNFLPWHGMAYQNPCSQR